jgi:Rps23 Pro-64 3,4-dihydroxylase Tpa1-like proline 4-hydroxylase
MELKHIDIERLQADLSAIKEQFNGAKPFRYVCFDNFFENEKAQLIHEAYPVVDPGTWNGITYVNQKNKFQKTEFEAGSTLSSAFEELNSSTFLSWLQDLTDFPEKIEADTQLFGGGLHQSVNGAFLNVHVDYNIHPETKYHRRLNVIVYMNQDWKDSYEGHLELWNLTNGKKEQIARIAPQFNRCVIFETNEISFHGHPKPLNTPEGVNRKSLATYYYTKTRPQSEQVNSHNTIYVNTEGVGGKVKQFNSGIKAFLERINDR